MGTGWRHLGDHNMELSLEDNWLTKICTKINNINITKNPSQDQAPIGGFSEERAEMTDCDASELLNSFPVLSLCSLCPLW